MKLNLVDTPPDIEAPPPAGPGTLYRTSHGTFYLLAALVPATGCGDRAHCVHFSPDGTPTGVKIFGAAYLERLVRVGSVPDMLTVEWAV